MCSFSTATTSFAGVVSTTLNRTLGSSQRNAHFTQLPFYPSARYTIPTVTEMGCSCMLPADSVKRNSLSGWSGNRG